jgi:hypothetical protein
LDFCVDCRKVVVECESDFVEVRGGVDGDDIVVPSGCEGTQSDDLFSVAELHGEEDRFDEPFFAP